MSSKRVSWIASALFVLASASPSLAHDASQHIGKPAGGEIGSASRDAIQPRTGRAVRTIPLTDKTTYESEERHVTRGRLRSGARETSFETKLEDGTAAKEVHAHEAVRDGRDQALSCAAQTPEATDTTASQQ